jgi:hypothetical protein
MNYRGRWTADSLSGQFFNVGDIVTDDSSLSAAYYLLNSVAAPSAGNCTEIKFCNVYIYSGEPYIHTNAPHAGTGGHGAWTVLSTIVAINGTLP